MFHELRQRCLTGLAKAVGRWPWLFIIFFILLTGACGCYAAMALKFKAGRNDLIGRNTEYRRLQQIYENEFHAEEDYIIVVEGNSPQRNQAAVNALAHALIDPGNNAPSARKFTAADVFYRIDLDSLRPRFLYYLSPDELVDVRTSIKESKQLLQILQNSPRLETFFSLMRHLVKRMAGSEEIERRKMAAFLPILGGIVQQLGEQTAATKAGSPWASPWSAAFFKPTMMSQVEAELKWNGYQAFRGGKMFLVLVHSNHDTGDGNVATVAGLRKTLESVNRKFPDLKIRLTGEPVLDVDEMHVSQRDTKRATILTLIAVGILFGWTFREALRPLLTLFCTVMAVVLTLGCATATVGHLNLITVTFAVMIVGLAVDLGIQFLARFEEELSLDHDVGQALLTTIGQTGRSILTAGITNAVAFFAMGLSGFRGVVELGIIAGCGMLIATAVMLTVFPATLALLGQRHRRIRPITAPAASRTWRFEQTLLRQPYATLGVCAIITIAALAVAWQVRIDYNVLNLQSRGVESVQAELDLMKGDAQSSIFAAVVCDNIQETRELSRKLSALPTVATVASIADFLPEQQEQKLALIRSIQKELGPINFRFQGNGSVDVPALLRLLRALDADTDRLLTAVSGRGEKTEKAVRTFATTLATARHKLEYEAKTPLEPLLIRYQRRCFEELQAQLKLLASQRVDRPMTMEDVPPELRRMLAGQSGKLLLRVFPKENIWERGPLTAFMQDVQSVAPNAVGTPRGLYEELSDLLRGYRDAALWAFAAIAILIFLDFGGLLATALTLLPLLTGIAWTLGAMVILDVPFNPANIMALPLLVGIAVAYGIYVVKRYREEHSAEFYSKSTGRAVVVSALVTMIAFGSLILGADYGISSLGILMTLGVGTCLMAALLLLPAMLELCRRKKWDV